jgi:flagellar basal-body rod protein FlgG
MDIAINGEGYIPVTQPDGTTAYTRDGSFVLNGKGYLVTPHGDMVGDGIQLPLEIKHVQFKNDGSVWVQTEKTGAFSLIGHIGLVRFANAEKLNSIGYNKLVATSQSGEPVKDTQSLVKQGFLERSNVNVHMEVEQVLRLNASLISNMRIIKFADQIYQQAVNLRQ